MIGQFETPPLGHHAPSSLYARHGKRLLDVVLSSLAVLLLWPVVALVACLVRLDSPGRILFRQDRVGRHGKVFRAYKFRTMIDRPRSPDHEIMEGDAEVTRLGRWLRRLKLDELPQLWNVLKGDMSIVGPRPALPAQVAAYDARARRRLLVRPGLTGRAQVAGNIHLSWPERWQYDALYVDSLSLALDVRIILRTVAVLILGEHRLVQPPTS